MSARRASVAAGSLERTLLRRFRTAETVVETAAGPFAVLHPASAEDLINEADFEIDERLPYWADIWPSSTVLAGAVAALDGNGRRLLELGCGVGLVVAAAASAGFEVTATDYYRDALAFAAVNAWRVAGAKVRTELVDWRDFPITLGTFDLVVASDVLYERPYASLVAAALHRTLAPDGHGLLADPGRFAAPAFVDECESRGLTATVREHVAFEAGEIRQRIALYEIRHQL